MQMPHNYGLSPLKALHNKTDSMMRYGNQTIMHDNTEDMPSPHNTAPLDNTPLNCSMPEQDSESSTK